jgi:DNA polymerase-3 subunit epsilon
LEKLRKILFGGSGKPVAGLAEDVRDSLEAWRVQSGTDLGQPHYQIRYAVVDVATSGLRVEQDKLLGIAGVGLERGALIVPDDAFALDLDLAGEADGAMLDRQLAAFLRFVGQAPLVTYQAPFVGAFLERLFEERFGLHFQPDWIDLAWLLPDLFKERIDGLVPMDAWLETFGIEVPGRRDPLADSVALARLLQLALVRAVERGADTPGKLLDIGRARRWLRHSG